MMNPTLDSGFIERAIAEDPEAGRAEWEAEWRTDISQFIPLELVETAVIPGRHELPRIDGVAYQGFADPSGGRSDSFTLAVAHRENSGRIVLDVLRETRPLFSPESVVHEYSTLLKAYGISEVGCDRYAGTWPQEAFLKNNVMVKYSEKSASDLYIEFLPLLSAGRIELPDSKRMISQLTALERRVRSGGRDMVTHYPGGHDDLANAVAGACFEAETTASGPMIWRVGDSDDKTEGWPWWAKQRF